MTTETPPHRLCDLIDMCLDPCTDDGRLTQLAEELGRHYGTPEAIDVLIKLLRHERPVVREGALLGLAEILSRTENVDVEKRIRKEFITVESKDPSPVVRSVASDILL